jgi:DNA-binding response OmpR family regulator
MKILICGENKLFVKLISLQLQLDGYETIMAHNGVDACRLLLSDPPDILISDVVLPQTNGFEFIRSARLKYPQLLIIVISNLASEQLISQVFRLGANDFISTPFDPEYLKIRIKRSILTQQP